MKLCTKLVTIAATVALASTALAPAAAFADQAADVAAARARLQEVGSALSESQTALSQTGDSLENIKGQISQVDAQIADTQAKYDASKQKLAGSMHDDYTAGKTSVLDVILGSRDLDDVVSGLYIFMKESDARIQQMQETEKLKNELNDQKADLEAKRAKGEEAQRNAQAKTAEYKKQVAEAQAYFNSLSASVQKQLTEELQSDVEQNGVQTNDQGVATNPVLNAVTTVAQANYTQAVASNNASSIQNDAAVAATTNIAKSAGQNTSFSAAEPSAAPSQASSPSGATKTPSASTSTGDWLSRASSLLGTPYVWGGSDNSGVDCSGYVNLVYGGSRGRTTYDMMASSQSDGTWHTDFDNMQPGDVIITSGGNHVGIYAGNGKMYNATKPGEDVRLSDLTYFDKVGYIPGSQY